MADVHPISSGASGAASQHPIAMAERTRAEARTSTARRPPARQRRKTVASVLTHAVLLLASAFFILPIVWIISTSLKPLSQAFDGRLIPSQVTFANYTGALSDPAHPFWNWALNSVYVAIATMIVGVLLSLAGAYALSRYEFLGKQGVLLSFLITQMFPGALLLIPLYRLFSSWGLLGHPYGLIIAYATTSIPFSIYLLKNFFDAVPQELDQAGLIDGLGPFGVFWRIVAPLTIPGIAVVAFFNFMNAWNEFMLARAFLTDNNTLTLPVGLQSYVFQFGADWGRLTAASSLVTIPVFVLFIWAQRYLITGLTGGSVKG